MTMEEEARFHTLVGELVGDRASDLNDLFGRFEDHHPEEPHYYLSLWGTHRDQVGRGLGTALLRDKRQSCTHRRGTDARLLGVDQPREPAPL